MLDVSDLKAEIESVLIRAAKSENIENFEVQVDLNVRLGDGFMGQIYTGEIVDQDKKKKLDVVIKKTLTSEADFEAVYKNEVVFYTSVYPVLMQISQGTFKNVPKLYCWHKEGDNAYLVMENLKSKGYELYPKELYFDEVHLILIFTTYAKFHALSFIWKKRYPDTFQKVHHEEYRDLYQTRLEASKNILKNSTQAALNYLEPTSEVYQEMKTLPQNILATLLKACEYTGKYSCSMHGDCWSNNMMFRYGESREPEELKLIDFQLGRESTPVHDLSYFFYSGASKSDMDKLEDYLKVYHNTFTQTLQENGFKNDLFPYKVLVEEWKEHALLGLIYGIHFWQIKLTPKTQLSDELKDANNAGNIDKLVKFLEKVGKTVASTEFRDRVVPLLIHGYESGILRKNKIVQ